MISSQKERFYMTQLKLIKEKKAKDVLITSRYDLAFKAIMLKNKDILERILETALEKPIEITQYIPQELPAKNVLEKERVVDLIVKSGNEYYEIEVNTSNGLAERFRNLDYFMHFITSRNVKENKKYNLRAKFMQVNLSYNMDTYYSPKTYDLIEEYKIQTDSKKTFVNNFSILEINMDKVMKAWYDKKEESIQKYKYFIMLDLEERNVLNEFVRGDKLMEKYKDELLELNSDEEFVSKYTREEELEIMKNTAIDIAKEEGKEQGKEIGIEQGLQEGEAKAKIELAKKMLEKKMPIEDIMEITGLSKEEILHIE